MPRKSNKLRKSISGKNWLWLTLLTCSGIFLFPFIWMIVSSIKTDEDINRGDFWPSMPEFRPNSPYVIDTLPPEKPSSCPPSRWHTLLPKFIAHTTAIVQKDAARPRLFSSDEEDEQLVEQASQFLVQRGLKKMPQQVWQEKDDATVEAAFQAALRAGSGIRGELEKTYARIHARFEIHGLKVRSRGAGVIYQEKFTASSQTKLPEVTDPTHGKLEFDADGTLVLRSHFTSPSDSPITVRHQFTVNTPASDIFRIIIPLKHDASWHQLHAGLEINGIQYSASRSIWLAQNRAAALTLQVTDNDKEEWGKRPWLTMKKTGGTKTPEKTTSHITLTLTLDPSSTTAARYGKVKRNYERVLLSMPFWKYVINSIIITLLSIFGAVTSSCFIAYAFARLKWPGRSIAFLVLLSTMMLPPQVTMIPQFLIWREIGWYNTLNPIWIPTWFGIAFFIFLMVQQMKTIPRDLEEAAEIDGMNRLQTWWYVILPLVRPAMAAIAIMSFMASWNEFMQPLIYLRDMGRFPLSVGIYAMGADDTMNHDMPLILAGNILMTLPVLVIFFIFQRYFIQGVASAGVKG